MRVAAKALSRLPAVLEALANLATVAACVAVCFAVVRGRKPELSAASAETGSYAPGDAFAEASDIDFKAAPRTLVVFLSSRCGYCEASMPFYRTLAESPRRKNGGFRLVAASGEDEAVMTEYLKRNQLAVDQIVRWRSTTGKIRGTPTIVLVDEGAHVKRLWRGRLPKENENEVLKAVDSP